MLSYEYMKFSYIFKIFLSFYIAVPKNGSKNWGLGNTSPRPSVPGTWGKIDILSSF